MHYVLQGEGVDLQQKVTETQGQKVLPEQWVHRGRKSMKEAEECPQRVDIRADEQKFPRKDLKGRAFQLVTPQEEKHGGVKVCDMYRQLLAVCDG